MGVTPSPLFQDGLALKANNNVVTGANPVGLNNILSDALSLSQATSQTVTGPLVMNGALTTTSGCIFTTRLVTAAGAITMTTSDGVVFVKKTVGAATAVTLPVSPTTGLRVSVKDAKGDAEQNPVTISPASGTIDGAASVVLNAAYASIDLIYNSTEWSIL